MRFGVVCVVEMPVDHLAMFLESVVSWAVRGRPVLEVVLTEEQARVLCEDTVADRQARVYLGPGVFTGAWARAYSVRLRSEGHPWSYHEVLPLIGVGSVLVLLAPRQVVLVSGVGPWHVGGESGAWVALNGHLGLTTGGGTWGELLTNIGSAVYRLLASLQAEGALQGFAAHHGLVLSSVPGPGGDVGFDVPCSVEAPG